VCDCNQSLPSRPKSTTQYFYSKRAVVGFVKDRLKLGSVTRSITITVQDTYAGFYATSVIEE
jgi:hypothetical protein